MFWLNKYIQERRIKKSLAHCFQTLAALQSEFFNAYIKLDYLDQQYFYAKKLYIRRTRFFCAMQKARKLLVKNLKYNLLFVEIERLSEIVFSLHLLRFRTNDYAVFEICQQEFRSVLQHLTILFRQLINFSWSSINTGGLQEAIRCFEVIYDHTLQIVTRDPIVFLFFIQDLYSVQEMMQNISQIPLVDEDENNISK